MPLEILQVHFDCAGSQNLLVRGAVRIFEHGGHFSWQAQGKPRVFVVQNRLWDRSGLTSKCRFRGRCSTLDMAVIFEAL